MDYITPSTFSGGLQACSRKPLWNFKLSQKEIASSIHKTYLNSLMFSLFASRESVLFCFDMPKRPSLSSDEKPAPKYKLLWFLLLWTLLEASTQIDVFFNNRSMASQSCLQVPETFTRYFELLSVWEAAGLRPCCSTLKYACNLWCACLSFTLGFD